MDRARRHTLLRMASLLALLIGSPMAHANVYVYPSSASIELFGDHIVFLSADSRRVVCIDRGGSLLWEKRFGSDIFVHRCGESAMCVQEGDTVLSLDGLTGEVMPRGTAPKDMLIMFDAEHDIAGAVDRRFRHKRYAALDPRDLAILWESSEMESVVAVARDRLFAVAARRTYDEQVDSFTRDDAAVLALDRATGRVLWRHALKDRQAGSAAGFWRSPHLVVLDGAYPASEILALDGASGTVVAKQVSENRDAPAVTGDWATHRITDIEMEGDEVVVLVTSRCGGLGSHCDRGELRWCALPSLETQRTVTVESGEILKFWLLDDYILTGGIYEFCCFERPSGRRLWRTGQIGTWEADGLRVIVSSYSKRERQARIVAIELRTGSETVLFSEPCE